MKYAEEAKVARQQAATQAAADSEDPTVLDTLLKKLSEGNVVRRPRRAVPPSPDAIITSSEETAAIKAQNMLAALQQDGFQAFAPPSPRSERPGSTRKTRLRSALSISSSAADFAEEPRTPSSASHTRNPTEDITEEEAAPPPSATPTET